MTPQIATATKTAPATQQADANARIRSFVERVERLNEEIKALNQDKSEVFTEAKSSGFDVKALKEVIRLRAMETEDRQNRDAMVELYRQALGISS